MSRLLARNTGWNLLGQVLPLVLALLAIPDLARRLGPDAFGLLALAWLVLTFSRELGLGRATTKFVAERAGVDDSAGAAALVWLSAAAQLALGVVGGGALALSAAALAGGVLGVPPELAAEARTALLLVAAALPPLLVTGAFRGALEGLQRFGATNAVAAPVAAGGFLLPLVAVRMGWGITGAVALLVLLRVAALAATALLAFRALPELVSPRTMPGDLRRLLGFGGWISVSALLSPILVHADRALIALLVGVAAVGYYTPAFELSTRLLILPVAVVGTLFPAISALAARGDHRRAGLLASRSVRYLLLLLGPAVVFFVAAADTVLRLWLGADFAAQGAPALRILALGVLVNALAHVPFSVLQGSGRADLTAKLHLLELPLHLVVAWLLVARWGITGAAAAWTLRVSLDAAALFALSRRVAPDVSSSPGESGLGRALVLLVASFAAAGVLAGAAPDDPARLVLVALVALAGLAAAWPLGLGEQDRLRLRRILGVPRGG